MKNYSKLVEENAIIFSCNKFHQKSNQKSPKENFLKKVSLDNIYSKLDAIHIHNQQLFIAPLTPILYLRQKIQIL